MRICLTDIEPPRSFGGHHGLRGHLNSNIHIHTKVFEVTEFKSEVTFDLLGHLEATMASEAT